MKKARFKIVLLLVFSLHFIKGYAQSNPYELVNDYNYESLYEDNVPNANYFDVFGIFDIATIGDNVYFGMSGSSPFGAGDAWTTISRGVLGKIEGTNTPVIEGVLDDEGFMDMKRLGNELIINGPDATDYISDFRIGFNYTYSEGDGFIKYGEEHSFRQIQKTTTDANGNYAFSNLPSDYYFVRFVRPANFELSPKISNGPCSAPVWTTGSTWVRRDWEEQADSFNNDAEYKTEPLFNGYNGSFPGAYVEVSGPNAGSPFPYVNNNIDCGLTEVFGVTGDTPYEAIPIIEFPSDEPRETVIGGKVWNDTNGDGIMGVNEPGLAGVEVEIYSYGYYFPNAIHSFGVHIDEENGEAYIPMGTGSNNVPIYKYTQNDKTWSLAGNIPAANRSWRLSKLNDTWYSKHYYSLGSTLCSPISVENEGSGLYYSTDLFNWFLLSDDIDRNSNFVNFQNRLVHYKTTNTLESIQEDQTLEEHIIPDDVHNLGYNAVTAVSNDYVYVGTETGAIYRSTDLSTWSYMGTTQNPIYSLHYWEEKNALLIGTGESSNGKIYRMDDVGDQIFQCGTDFEAFSLHVEKQEGDQYSLNWDELSAGTYIIRVYDHSARRWYTMRTTENSYTFDASSLSTDSSQFDFLIVARCLSTNQTYRTKTVSVGDNCCELSCKTFDLTARWNTRIDDDVDLNWTSISGSSSYQIYWSTDNNDWNLLEGTEDILPTNTYFDGDNVRGFMEENAYDTIYLKVRAVCDSGSYYDSESAILDRYASTLSSKEISDNILSNTSVKNLFTIVPNPVNKIATMTVLKSMEQYSIDVFNLNGQNVYHLDGGEKLQNDQIELDFSHLSSGVYMVSFKSSKYTNIIKILVN